MSEIIRFIKDTREVLVPFRSALSMEGRLVPEGMNVSLQWWLDNGGAKFIRDLVENLSDAELRTMGFEVVPPKPPKPTTFEVGGWAKVMHGDSHGSCVAGGTYEIAKIDLHDNTMLLKDPMDQKIHWFSMARCEPALPPEE
jgi:hypothetical protein